ncbi:MAG: CDP-archaeol synthase [Chlamydiae bacterium]|nr:CDP-archaeol synthase [Chlamydiota bacterium]
MDVGDLKKRLPGATFSILAVAALIYFSQNPILQIFLVLIVALLAVVGIWEYVQLLHSKKIEAPFWLLAVLAVCFVFANYLAVLNIGMSLVLGFVIVAFFFSLFLYHFYKIENAIVNLATSFFGTCYVAVPLGLMIRILYPTPSMGSTTDGSMWLTYLIVVTKITDMGAYFGGKLLGRSKLAPHLSPKKTIAGSVSGFFAAVIVSIIFYLFGKMVPDTLFKMSFIQSICLGGLLGVFSQLGDLAESLLKRDANVKDSNKIAGLGGVLDTLDSLLFTTPIVYLYMKTL